jgi:hypothetical protein
LYLRRSSCTCGRSSPPASSVRSMSRMCSTTPLGRGCRAGRRLPRSRTAGRGRCAACRNPPVAWKTRVIVQARSS